MRWLLGLAAAAMLTGLAGCADAQPEVVTGAGRVHQRGFVPPKNDTRGQLW